MTPEQAATILDLAPVFAKLKEKAEEVVLDALEDNDGVPGYRLGKGRGKRYWADKEKAEAFVGDDENCFTPRELKSPAQIEKLHPRISKSLIGYTPGGVRVVPENSIATEVPMGQEFEDE